MRHLKEQRGFSDSGLSTHEHSGSRHDSAAEDAVEFGDAAGKPRRVGFVDLLKGQRLGAAEDVAGLGGGGSGLGAGVGSGSFVFLQAVPRAAVGALAHPFGMNAAAMVAEKLD